MKNVTKLLAAFTIIVAMSVFSSCRKVFDVTPEQSLDKEQMYRNVYDADAAVLGLYGKFLGLAKQYVLLNELRADLMEITVNADDTLRQLSAHNVVQGNPYANPRTFYEVILNCNDVMKNFDVMLRDKKMSQDEYDQRYADVASLRAWTYLQVGIHFGEVPYVTDALETVDDVRNISLYPRLTLDKLIDTLINETSALNYKDLYASGTSLITVVDGYNTTKFFINKKCLLGDLYLWRSAFTKSSQDAKQAAIYYKEVMETGATDPDMYRVKQPEVLSNNDLAVNYWADGRIRKYNENDLVDDNNYGWRSMFARGQDILFNTEWIWILPFDKSFKPANPFIDLFSNRGGRYLVKPSQEAIENWNSQVQADNNFPYDARGKMTYKILSGQPVIMKYLYNYLHATTYTPTNILEKPGKWFLYRAATLHLRYAEAANRDGQIKVAYSLVNNGIKPNYDNNPGADTRRDVGNTQQTFLPFPYNFDARMGDYPSYRAPWHRNVGLRGRANLKVSAIDSVKFYDMNALPRVLLDSIGLVNNIEDKILDEAALELAYEGNRWADLLRIAIRRDDPSILANKVYDKLSKDNMAAEAVRVKTKLMSKDWFLPFKW
jgi:starch-binding outer membrane protein, SusD/RagB family